MRKRNLIFLLPIIILIIFIISIWDKNYYVGGDLMYPLVPQNNILRSLYVGGEHLGQSYFDYCRFLWYFVFYSLSLILIPSFVIEKIFIVSLYILGFIFSYLSFRQLFIGFKFNNPKSAFLAALLFVLNPAAILMPNAYPPLFVFPACYFFFIKYLDSRKSIFILPFVALLSFAFFSDFPQPKLLIVFSLSLIFLLMVYLYLRKMKLVSLLSRLVWLIILTLLLNAFIIPPFLYDLFGSGGFFGFASQAGGEYNGMADLYSAALPYISRFYNSNVINSTSLIGNFFGNPIFIIWTFFLWVMIISTVFILKNTKEKKLFYLLLLFVLVFIFVAKGPNPPFAKLYIFSLLHIPFFKIFRTTSTVIFGGIMFYIWLLTLSVYFFSLRFKKIFYIILFIHLAIFSPMYLGFQFFQNPVDGVSQKGISLPKEYFDLGKVLDKLKDSSKVLVLPQDEGYIGKSWYFNGTPLTPWVTQKLLLHNGLNLNQDLDNFSSKSLCLLTSLYDARYFLWEKDTTNVLVKKDIQLGGKDLINNKYFLLKKIDDLCVLPTIYIPDQNISFFGETKNLFDIADYLEENKMSSLYVKEKKSQENNISPPNEKILLEAFPQDIFWPEKDQNFTRLYLGSDKMTDDLWYPYVRIPPDSLFYPFVLFKEQNSEKSSNFDQRQLLDKKLFFATKRIAEIMKWGPVNNWWEKNLKMYEQKINEAISLAVSSDKPRDNLELISEYLVHHESKIGKDIDNKPSWDKNKIDQWETTLESLKEKTRKSYIAPKYNQYRYKLIVPQAGLYELFIDGLPIDSRFDLDLNNLSVASSSSNVRSSGNFNFQKGENLASLMIYPGQDLIDPKAWQQAKKKEVKFDLSSITFTDDNQGTISMESNAPVVFQNINNWQANKTYLLKINYQNSNGGSGKLFVQEKRNLYNQPYEKWEEKEYVLTEEILRGDNEFMALLKSNKNSTKAIIYLYGNNGTTKINSIELKEISLPKIILKSVSSGLATVDVKPEISFEKIDPTFYRVKITKASLPYFLILSQSFNREWKLEINGKIIPESRHYLVNGYANSWYILPIDSSNRENYSLVIRYVPQRYFYIGMIVSIITFLSIIIFAYVKKN